MAVELLDRHIDSVLGMPNARAAFDSRVDAFAAETGTTLGPNDHQGLAEMAEAYVRAVVELLVAFDHAATVAGIAPVAQPIVQTAVSYMMNPADYIPDQAGLYGLLDDAYLACRFVARVSELVQAERGFPLLDTSLDQNSPIIRVLIGEPLASQLDQDIDATVTAILQQVQMAQMHALSVQHGTAYETVQRWESVHQQRAINDEARLMAIASGSF